jgi:uncharacterized membrane protein HdeD (DUF308 family)
MNIIKRLLNVVALFGAFVVLGGIFSYFFDSKDSTDAFVIGGVLLGFVLVFNYILFQNISVWNRLEKKNN